MEITKKDQSPAVSLSGSKLLYPLRSSARLKAATVDSSESSSAFRRVRPLPSVIQSVVALDLSAKDKSAKPPRRLSIPSKLNFSPHQPSIGSITPVSEARLNRSKLQGKSDTPRSEVSDSAGRRKFNVLSSVSYWLTQIKLSESASKHSISIGFFKLALESGCEPLQRIREELKSYVRKYNLLTEQGAELGEAAKDLLQSYNVLEELEQLKLSENNSQLQEEGISASKQSGNLKHKSLILCAVTNTESNRKGTAEKRVPMPKNRASNLKNREHTVSEKDVNVNNSQNKLQKPMKVELNRGNAKARTPAKDSASNEDHLGDSGDIVPFEGGSHENKENVEEEKENMDSMSMDEALLKEEIQTT